MSLYHFTCDHGRDAIGNSGTLVPTARLVTATRTPHVPPQGYFVWLTDLAIPDRYGLGLTSETLSCDRMVHRYRVIDETLCKRWGRIRAWLPELHDLELAPGALPRHWWISTAEVPVEYDPIPVEATA